MKREDKLIRIDNMAKCQVIPSLVSLLQAAGEDVRSIELKAENNKDGYLDTTYVWFPNGGFHKVSVAGDSPLAMCRDILKCL